MIKWDLSIPWYYEGDKTAIKRIKISEIKPNEKPSSYKVKKIIDAMESGTPIPIITVTTELNIMDGHHRFHAAKKILGVTKTIPVLIIYPPNAVNR